MDYTQLGLLAAAITSHNSGLDYKEGANQKTFDGKAVLAWLLQNWPGVVSSTEANTVAQALVSKAIINAVTGDDKQFNEKNTYTFAVNTNGEVLVEHDYVEFTTEELVALSHKHLKKQMTGAQVVAWLIKDLKVSRKHAVHIGGRLLAKGLLTGGSSSEGFQPTDTANYTVTGHVTQLPSPDDISKVYELEHVPSVIANDCKMDGVRLVYKGYLVAKYHRSPLLIVSHVTEDSVSICAPANSHAPAPHPHASVSVAHATHAPIAHWVSHKSNVFALFSNGALEGVDVESKQAQEYPATTQALASQVIGLLADDVVVIGLVSNGLIIWERSGSRPPRLVNLSIQVSVPIAPDFCSLLPENQVLLVYTGQNAASDPVFTLWHIRDLATPKVHLLIKGTIQDPYGRVTCVAHHKDRLVFAGEKSKLMCWIRPSTEEPNAHPSSGLPPTHPSAHPPAHAPAQAPAHNSHTSSAAVAPYFVKSEPKDARANTLFVDNWFLLVGDTTGQVTLHSRKTGERIYALNVPCGNAVSKIVRVGRWIFCAYDTKLAVYDIYRSDHPAPIQLYTSSTSLPIRDFQVNPGAITLLLGGPPLKTSTASTSLQFVSSSLRTSNQSIGVSATASVSRAGRTKVAVWAPRLDALDVYLKKPSLAQSHPILPALIYTYRRIVDILSKCVHEDVAEYRATLEWMRLTIDWIIKSSHERREDVKKIDVMGIGGVPFLVLRSLQLAGDKYCAALVRACPPGSDPKQVFSRVLSSSRRRAELDRLNAAMYASLSDAVSAVGSGWQHINTNEPPFIDDTEGCSMWKAGFGASCLMADWSRFFDILRVHQSPVAPYDASQEAILRYILDPSGTHHVSQHRFGAFLRGFGPLTQCISKTLLITNPSWFVGYLSRVEGEILLQTQVPGTFMIRLSRSAHAFTISVMHSDGKVHHIVVDPRPTPPSSPSDFSSPQISPTGAPLPAPAPAPAPPSNLPATSRPRVFTVLEAVGPERYFSSLVELIQNYPHALRMPYNDSLHSMPWFQGDITTEEAKHMLSQSKSGTFLVHLSNSSAQNPPLSPGSHTPFKLSAGGFAPLMVFWMCSVMGFDHTVHHLVIIQHVEGFSLATHTNIFPTLPALVKHYAPFGLLHAVETSCKTLPRVEPKEKAKGERNAVSMNISSSQTELLRKSGSTPSIPSSVSVTIPPTPATHPTNPANPTNHTNHTNPPTNANQPHSPGTNSRASYLQTTPANPSSLPESVPFSSPFPFTQKPAHESGSHMQSAANEVDNAVARAKSAIATLRQTVAPSADHYRLIILAQILLYSQRQLKSTTLLPPFKPPNPSTVYEPTLTPKQMDADRNVLLLSFPHLEYLLETQARDSRSDPTLFLGKLENIMDAIAIFDTKRKPMIGHMKFHKT